ncbi:MFS general substrate transporter [Hesseltinella vesiculosa]|uniref:MFS general substrate transporter n=1 Tax=Hesseltinella vesiculosa TaxID=101127 RepID=A0A1X2GJH8_9FUNG|nr:MFS general substrate transporter [Hesseltinella vesiculosa]
MSEKVAQESEKITETSQEETVLNDKSSASTTTEQAMPPSKADPSDPATASHERTRKEKIGRIMTFFALQLSLFLGALDGTIVSTCMPVIGSDFQQMSIVAWVATAYILTFDAFQPLFSKFSDIFGRKYTLLVGVFIFLFGSLMCGVAKTMIWLIICRAIAGIGAAGIFSGVFVVISEMVPLEKRGSYQGLINAVFALSSVLGPLIGGSLTEYVTWRWVFFINLPTGGVAMVLLVLFMDLPKKQQTSFVDKLKSIDYLGTCMVLAAALLFLLALNFGGQLYPWRSAAVITPLVLAFVIVFAFAYVEVNIAKDPIMPPHLFRNRSVLAILITNFWFGVSFFAVVYYLPVYFQVVRNDSAMWSGIRLIPMQMLICVFSSGAGFTISKTQKYRPMIWVGMAVLTLHSGLISLFDINTSFSEIYGLTVIGGCGMGLIFSSTIIGLQASVSPKDISVVTGLGNFSRLLGGAVGVAIASNVYNSQLTKNLPNAVPLEFVEPILMSNLFVHNGLPPQYLESVLNVIVGALRLLWYIMTPLTFLGLVSSTFVRPYSLRQPGQRDKKKAAADEEQKPSSDGPEEVVVDATELAKA